jgi:hypothetical protein
MNLLNDKDGKQSSMRLAMLAWAGAVLVAWLWTSYTQNQLVDIPQSVLTIVGVFVSGKVVQRFGENKIDNSVKPL